VKNAEESIQRGKNTAAQQKKRWPSRKKPAFRNQPITHGREDLNTYTAFEIKEGNTARDNSIQPCPCIILRMAANV
jgi:hypothetical protein